MRINEIIGVESEKAAAETMAQNAKRMKQQADQAKARVKVKSAQQQLAKAAQPIKPKLS